MLKRDKTWRCEGERVLNVLLPKIKNASYLILRLNTYCDENFILEEAMLYHQKMEHSHEVNSFKCELCEIEFFYRCWVSADVC